MSERIDPNMMHRRKCCICEAIAPDFKCVNCNLYFCGSHDIFITYHIDDNMNHSPYRYDYHKCCNYCCSNCYVVECAICGENDSNLNMKYVGGHYICHEHE